MQTRWRSKLAKRELRRRRAEARESGKLLQDKQALEHRLKEMQAILETVQNQRNELKQLYKVQTFVPASVPILAFRCVQETHDLAGCEPFNLQIFALKLS